MYCTVNDIVADITEKTLIELTDDSSVPENYNTGLIQAKIREASEYIDSYLVERYPLPIIDNSDLEILKGICVSLVVTELFRRRLGLDFSESLQRRRDEAIDNLDKIQRGIIKLRSGTQSIKPRYYRYTERQRNFPIDWNY
ncbi:DUF1320 domain-containing protein [Bacteroidetes/Chlorobi group bacterium Naka2016]|jgi:phage gp36-like protein|nr:MAG: DUF1320 domain-containing protein [Bacteroidetes/Chlorobi group bacterium Naka2016]